MIPADPSRPSIDPRAYVTARGVEALAELLAETGYVIQRGMVTDLVQVLRSGKPWLIEGPRGGGKTALAEALAKACNLPCFYLQGMQGLQIDDVLYHWDTEAQNQWLRFVSHDARSLMEARAAVWTREYLILGEALGAFELAARQDIVPVLIIDEADKLEERIEDMLLQLLGRGWAHVPRFGDVGLTNRGKWPITVLLSNDIRHDLSAPLRSRCVYSWLKQPTKAEEVRVLHVRVPDASPALLAAVVKIINDIRLMGSVIDHPGLRESIDFLEALVRDGREHISAQTLSQYLCYLAKRQTDLLNLREATKRLERIALHPHRKFDKWVEWAITESSSILEDYDETDEQEEAHQPAAPQASVVAAPSNGSYRREPVAGDHRYSLLKNVAYRIG